MAKARDGFFDKFAAHTRVKLFLLESYLERWATILLQRGHLKRVWFIDAFADEGRDDSGHQGSPLVACRIAAAVTSYFHDRGRVPPPEVRVVAIEQNATRFRKLEDNLKDVRELGSCQIETLKGTLDEFVDELLERARGEPMLLFLDPFGVKGLRADVLRRVLAVPKTELLILFTTSGAKRLHGAATAPRPRRKPQQPIRDLFSPEEHPPVEETADAEAEPEIDASERAWQSTAPASEEILNVAFGGDWWRDEIMKALPSERHRRWLELYMDVLHRQGAKYVLPFSVEDDRDKHVYYLVHASQHSEAVRAMKDAIREVMKRRERERGVQPLVYYSTVDLRDLARRIEIHFAGQTVAWTDQREPVTTVQGYAIRETEALFSDMEALKAALVERGYRYTQPGSKKLYFQFPRIS